MMSFQRPMITGNVQGFTHVRAPVSAFRPGGMMPVGAAGIDAKSSVFNLMKRIPVPAGANFQQNIVSRINVGWATNPLSGQRPVLHPGNAVNPTQAF